MDMPDLLTHYSASYLISSRFKGIRGALLISILGLLPDIDVLLKMHRWITHSVPLSLLIFLSIILLKRDRLGDLALAILLYELHLIMDLFTGPTPILWPLIPLAYSVSLKLDAVLGSTIHLNGFFEVTTSSGLFGVHRVVGGPLVTGEGVMIALVALIIAVMENALRKLRVES